MNLALSFFMPRRLEPPPLGSYSIVCPYCKAQNSFMLSGDYTDVSCPSCSGRFRVFVATVRAKRGRKSVMEREYLIRTITHSGEGVLRFTDFGGSDLDLRSSDIMYAIYKIDENGVTASSPSLLCNATIHQYAEIKPPRKSGCFIATVACGYDSWEVETLSSFRDNILSRNRIGFILIMLYYRISPYLAFYILKKEKLKKGIRKTVVFPIAVLTYKLFHL
jgi:hypothetical protein